MHKCGVTGNRTPTLCLQGRSANRYHYGPKCAQGGSRTHKTAVLSRVPMPIRLLGHIIGGVLLHLLPPIGVGLCRPSLNEPIIPLGSIYGVTESHHLITIPFCFFSTAGGNPQTRLNNLYNNKDDVRSMRLKL